MDHFLCLNQDRTKIIVVAPHSIQKEISSHGMFLDSKCIIRFVETAKNRGVVLDAELLFNDNVTEVVKPCFGFLRKLHSSTHFLTQDHLKSLLCSFIFSHLDYCNLLFYWLNSTTIYKLQQVQNFAACLISKKSKLISSEIKG